jgi:hypothetical protein
MGRLPDTGHALRDREVSACDVNLAKIRESY